MGIQMKNIARFYRNYYEWINYAIIAILCVLSCFFYDATWFLIGVVAVCACFYSTEKLVSLTIVMYLIQMPLLPGLFPILMGFVMLMFLKNFLISFFKRKQNISIKTLIVLLALIVYAIITHLIAPYTTFTYFIIFISDIFILYFTFLARKEIDVLKITRIFIGAIIVTGVICLISKFGMRFDKYNEWYTRTGYLKVWGMTENPNHYAGAVLIAISSLLALFFFEKINLPEFVITFVLLFIFGYLTISRNFLMAVLVALIIFGICYIIKYKFKAFEVLVPLCAIVCSICLLFSDQTSMYLHRVVHSYDAEGLEKAPEYDYDLIFAGLIDFNPGRIALWKVYLKRIFQTPIFTLFGLGVTAIRLGRVHPHNAYIQWLYKLGIVGLIIVAILFYLMIREGITENHHKNRNKLFYTAIAILPLLFMLLFDVWNLVNVATIIFLLSFVSCSEWKENSKFENEEQTKMIKGLLKKPSKF